MQALPRDAMDHRKQSARRALHPMVRAYRAIRKGSPSDLGKQWQRYPSLLHPATEVMKTKPKQSTRMLKVICLACGYVARITRRWINTGLPTCPCGQVMREE
jgi:hypothetical protein